MMDSAVQTTIRTVLLDGLTLYGYPSILVLQSFQPTKQGVPTTPVVYFTKIMTHRHGWQGRSYQYNETNANYDKTESYCLEATYQINAVIKQDLTDGSSVSSYDIVDLCAGILQSEETLDAFKAAEIGIERIQDIRTPRYLNDEDEFDEEPSFDFVLTYQRTLSSTVPAATVVAGTIHHV